MAGSVRLEAVRGRLPPVVRLVHPFPSLLDGVVVVLVALVAGGGPLTALALGLSMTTLQFSIGAVNDIVDTRADEGRKPGKPIPAGELSRGIALLVAASAAAGGLALAFVIGGRWLLALAALGLGIGYVYDLWAKGTTLSWVPLAIGIPLLPVFGWFGAVGELPGLFLVLVPAAANAGTALAIANAIVDAERDVKAGRASIATAIGLDRAAALVLVLHGIVALLAVGSAVAVGSPSGWVVVVLLASIVPLGGAALGILAAGRPGSALRELAWEVQAVGTGLLAVAWLSALSASVAPVAA